MRISKVRLVVEETRQPRIDADASDSLHGFLWRNDAIEIYPDDAHDIGNVQFIIDFIRLPVPPYDAGIFAGFDGNAVHSAPDIPIITGIGDVHATLNVHDSDLFFFS